MKDRISRPGSWAARVRSKRWTHWAIAVLVFVASHYALAGIEATVPKYAQLKAATFQFFAGVFDRRPDPRLDARVVWIGDEEYWRGELAGRRPLKRDYLAKLVRRLDDLDVRLIALDFHLRLPDPASGVIPEEYRAETEKLVEAIREAAKRRKVVLASTLRRGPDRSYSVEPSYYGAYGLCSEAHEDGIWGHDNARIPDEIGKNIYCGFINIASKSDAVPLSVDVQPKGRALSFSLSIAQAALPYPPEIRPDDQLYGTFISEDRVRALSATQVQDASLGNTMSNAIVIVGANWSENAFGAGPRVDRHRTPLGLQNGAVMHLNYLEALNDGRIYQKPSEALIEIAFGVLAALIFAGAEGVLSTLLAVGGVLAVLCVAEVLTVTFASMSLGVVGPVMGLGLHVLLEKAWTPSHSNDEDMWR